MKRIVALVMAVLLTLSMLAGCGGKGKSAPAATTEPLQEDRALSLGVVEGNTYTSAYAGFGCTLPEDWTLLSAEEAQDMGEIVEDAFSDSEIGAVLEEGQQFYDMYAESGDMMMNMNIVVQKLTAQERVTYKRLSEEEIADLLMEQKDTLTELYASAGMTLESMEKVSVDFLGEKHFAIKSRMDVQGIICDQLQIFNYSLGEYSVVLTLTSIEEDNTQFMLDMFFTAE